MSLSFKLELETLKHSLNETSEGTKVTWDDFGESEENAIENLSEKKWVDFIFFPKSGLKKLLKTKFSEFTVNFWKMALLSSVKGNFQ
jgi:hypothetical protein